jgi:hypothetical protein
MRFGKVAFFAGMAGFAASGTAVQAQLVTNATPGVGTYANSVTGSGSNFGNVLGGGSFSLTQTGGAISLSFTKGAGSFNDAVVIYFDPDGGSPAGFADTGGFTDGADGLRRAISGFDGGGSRSTLFFAPGFNATHAIAFKPFGAGNGYAGLWSLNNGASHGGGGTLNMTPDTSNQPTYTMGFNMSDLGLTPGQSFNFVATYIAESGFRSSELLGTASGPANNPGYTNLALSGNDYNRFVSAAVPEPATLGLLALPLMGVFSLRRRSA